MLMVVMVFGHCFVINREIISHYRMTWAVFETAAAFLMRDMANQRFD